MADSIIKPAGTFARIASMRAMNNAVSSAAANKDGKSNSLSLQSHESKHRLLPPATDGLPRQLSSSSPSSFPATVSPLGAATVATSEVKGDEEKKEAVMITIEATSPSVDNSIPAAPPLSLPLSGVGGGGGGDGSAVRQLSEVHIDGMSGPALRHVVNHLYGSHINVATMELKVELLMISDMLLLTRLKDIIQQDIINGITVENVSLCLATANKLQVWYSLTHPHITC
jgi:hypothetical protein